ncbi:MAG: SDR family oxidoreductase [Bacteroidales bacterium]|jgi:NAD(P)-dependent dehydrogenase (short-subunit alcohol dehydrogenase family)|nr:SDR family oxidoreductase [Bacteroidales bacterium]
MKTAVITGGTRGIGSALVRSFLQNGWNVAYSGTSENTLEESLTLLDGHYERRRYAAFLCDVTGEADIISLWDNAVKTFGSVDIWVNNAGISCDQTPFHKLDPVIFTGIIDTNVRGLMLATHVAYNRMLLQGYGAIYNMEGLGSDGRRVTGLTPYGTSKRAVRYFTDAFAAEVKGGRVIVGTISPGMVLTDMTMSQIRKDPDSSRQLIKIYNILSNEADTVAPYLVNRMIANRSNGAKISWLTTWKVISRFLFAPFSRRDIVSKYLGEKTEDGRPKTEDTTV